MKRRRGNNIPEIFKIERKKDEEPTITRIDDIKDLDDLKRKEIIFREIFKKHDECSSRNNDIKEKVFEFEFYDLIVNLLDVLYAFEKGKRKPLRDFDYYELLGSLKHTYKTFKGNIKFLEFKD